MSENLFNSQSFRGQAVQGSGYKRRHGDGGSERGVFPEPEQSAIARNRAAIRCGVPG